MLIITLIVFGFLDFNYNYGSPAPDSLLIKGLPLLLGTILGFTLTKVSDLITRRIAVNKAGADLLNEIALLNAPIEKQISSLDGLVTELKVKQFKPPKLELNFLLNTKRINLIDRNSVMEYFAKAYKKDRRQARHKLNELYVGLDIISFESERIVKLWDYYLEDGTKHFKEWKYNLDALLTYCSICVTAIERKGGKIEDDAFVLAFYNLTNEQVMKRQSDPQDIFALRENFHKPLAELGASFRTDERVEKLRMLNYQCFQAIRELEELKEECAFKFDRISKSLAKHYSKIEKESNDR